MGNTLLIGNVASRTGLTSDTIRYYERLGLLPKPGRTPAGYRMYGEGVVNRLTLIRNAQQFGFSLREIATFLRVRAAGGKPCRDVRLAAETMLNAVDQQIAHLLQTRTRMHDTLRVWDRRLAETADDEPAYLLETLGSVNRARGRRRTPLKNRR
jgi:DNA-binding transcriptional MerR regulator